MQSEKNRKETSKEPPKKLTVESSNRAAMPVKTTVAVSKKVTTITTSTTKQTAANGKASTAVGKPSFKYLSPKPLGFGKRSEEIAIEDYKTQTDYEEVIIEDKLQSESESGQPSSNILKPSQADYPKPSPALTPPRFTNESPISDQTKKASDRTATTTHAEKKRPTTDFRSQKQPASATPPPNKHQPPTLNKTPQTTNATSKPQTKPSPSPKPSPKPTPNPKPQPATRKEENRTQIEFVSKDAGDLKMPSLEKASSEVFDETADGIDEKIKTLEAFMKEKQEDPAPFTETPDHVKVDLFQSMIISNQSKSAASKEDRLQLSTMMNDSKNTQQFKSATAKVASPSKVFIPNYQKSTMDLDQVQFRPLEQPSLQEPPSKPSAYLSVFNDPARIFDSFVKLGVDAEQAPMVSTVCALEIKTKADPETNVRRLLNTDQAFDQKSPDRDWVNWGSKSFLPRDAATSKQNPTLSTFIGKSDTFEATRKRLEQAGRVFEDESFPPNMATLRGFGSDESWE